jgi:hypothetical protein
MIARIQKQPFHGPSQRNLRLQGIGLISLGIGVLSVWNPLTQPGPTVCLLRHSVGLPCPLCGMTRGVALCLRGHPIEASQYNPLAVPVLLLALILVVKWIIECRARRSIDLVLTPPVHRVLVIVGYLIFFTSWCYLITYRREDSFAASWLGQVWTWMTH